MLVADVMLPGAPLDEQPNVGWGLPGLSEETGGAACDIDILTRR